MFLTSDTAARRLSRLPHGVAGRRRLTCRRGALVVETSVVIGVLLLVFFAAFELARANMLRHGAEAAAYEGARVGIVPGATRDEIRSAARYVLNSLGARGASIDVQDVQDAEGRALVQVSIELPMRGNISAPAFFTKSAIFRGQCSLHVENEGGIRRN